MATVIQIKRSTSNAAPSVSDLSNGELAYVQDASNNGASAKLFIESVDSSSNPVIHEVGGKYYTDIVGATKGSSGTAGLLKFHEDTDYGTSAVTLKSPDSLGSDVTLTLPSADGSANQALVTNGSGALSFASTTSTIGGATDTNITSPADGGMLLYDTGTSKWIDNVMSGDATLTDGGVLTIAADAVEQSMIADDAVGADQLASSAVVTASMVDDAVTAAKLASNAVVFASIDGAAVINASETVASNSTSDVTFPTTKAVFDYVSAIDVDDDLTVSDGSSTGTINMDSQNLTIAGTANEIETSMSGQTLTVGLPNDVTVANNLTVSGNLISDDITTATLTTSGNLTVTGNLAVNGTTTTVNSTTVNIADPVFEIGSDSSDDNLDRGIKFKYNDGSAKVGFFGMDESNEKFIALHDATDSSSVFSGTAMDAIFGSIEGVGLALSGSITSIDGSAPTNGQLMIGTGTDFAAGTLTAGEGLDVTNASGTITISAEDATVSNKGIASFATAQFDVSSGAVSIKDATSSVKGIASFGSDFTVSSGAVSVTSLDGGTF